jgi:hypothetical protein
MVVLYVKIARYHLQPVHLTQSNKNNNIAQYFYKLNFLNILKPLYDTFSLIQFRVL